MIKKKKPKITGEKETKEEVLLKEDGEVLFLLFEEEMGSIS